MTHPRHASQFLTFLESEEGAKAISTLEALTPAQLLSISLSLLAHGQRAAVRAVERTEEHGGGEAAA